MNSVQRSLKLLLFKLKEMNHLLKFLSFWIILDLIYKMNKENKMVNTLKKQEIVLNNSPLTTKEFLKTLKKFPNFHSLYLTYNLDFKVFSALLIPENLKLISLVEEIKKLETNNRTTNKTSLWDFNKLTQLTKLLTSSSQDSDLSEVTVMKKKPLFNLLKSVKLTQSALSSKLPPLWTQNPLLSS